MNKHSVRSMCFVIQKRVMAACRPYAFATCDDTFRHNVMIAIADTLRNVDQLKQQWAVRCNGPSEFSVVLLSFDITINIKMERV